MISTALDNFPTPPSSRLLGWHVLDARPKDGWMMSGGRSGRHTEHLGHMLAEMQFLQRAYPGQQW